MTPYTFIRDAGSFRVRWTYTQEYPRLKEAKEAALRLAKEENCTILLADAKGTLLAAYRPQVTIAEACYTRDPS